MLTSCWYVAKGKTKLGPFSRAQLKQQARSGQLLPGDMVLEEGASNWTPARTVEGVFAPILSPEKVHLPQKDRPKAPARKASPRPFGRALVYLGGALAACGCLAAVPASLISYYFFFAPNASNGDARPISPIVQAAERQDPAPVAPEDPTPVTPKLDPPKTETPQDDPPNSEAPKANPPKTETRAGDQLAPEVLKKVKQATVYLRVTLPNGRVVQGSGFFAGAPNVVLTNGHVLGMLSHEGRQPQKIEVVVNSGTVSEKTYGAKLGQVDATDDLAAIVVAGQDLPEPLPIGLARDLFETQTVFVFGFPFGKQLGSNITVSKTSISALRTRAGGAIQDIQVNGGMNPGNSGGPLVDANGLVVGVAVAGMKGTNINFAIAGENVQAFLGGRMVKRVYLAPFKEGDTLKLPIRYHMTDPVDQIARVVVETWTGKPGDSRKAVGNGVEPLPGDSPHQAYQLGYKAHVAEGEVVLPVIANDQALWVQLSLIKRDGKRITYAAGTYPNKSAPVERRPVTLAYEHRPNMPCKLDILSTTDLKLRALDGTDKHIVTEIKAQMMERLIGNPDANGTMAGLITFSRVDVKTTLDKQVLPDPTLPRSLKSIAALAAMTQTDKQGDVKPQKMHLGLSVKDKTTAQDLAWLGAQLMQSIETVTVPLPGLEVVHERPWKVQRKLKLGSQRASQPAILDVVCILHGTREGNGRSEAVVLLFGQVRGEPGAVLSVGGYMDGLAVVDLKTNQLRFAEANLNLDLDVGSATEPVQAAGTLKITMTRTPLEGAERDKLLADSTPTLPGKNNPPEKPAPVPPAGPLVGGKTKIQGGAFDPEFSEAAPEGGLLVGFELGLKKFFDNDVVRTMRPIFRVGATESLGQLRGTDTSRLVKVTAKPGYAVGAITARSGLTVDGMSVTFMKIAPGGRLDPTDAYESAWIGGMGGGGPVRLGGDGTPVIGVIGKSSNTDMTGLGLLLRQ